MNRPTDTLESLWLLSLVLLVAIACVGMSTLPTRDRVREMERRIDLMEKWHPVYVYGAAEAAVAQGRRDLAGAEKEIKR
jgi:hypothetical protein